MQEVSHPVDEPVLREHVSPFTDFVRGFATSGIEKPVNAVLDIADHVTGSNLPKLDIVDDPTGGIASTLGSIAGTTADIALLSYGTGKAMNALGVPGAGLGYGTMRLGVTGAVYGSVFQPSASSEHFWADRAKNGMIEGTTWATIGAVSGGLVGHGVFRPEGMRSLTGSILLGATSGAAGGVVHANAAAILREGRLATAGETFSEAGQFAVAGAVFGAINHVGNEIVSKSRASDLSNQAKQQPEGARQLQEVAERAAEKTAAASKQIVETNPNRPPEYVDKVLTEGTPKSFSYRSFGRTNVSLESSMRSEAYPGGLKIDYDDFGTPEASFPRGTRLLQEPGMIKGIARDGTRFQVQPPPLLGFDHTLRVQTQMPDGTKFFFEDGNPVKAVLPDGRAFTPVKTDGGIVAGLLTEKGTTLLPDGTQLMRGGTKILTDGTQVYETRGGIGKTLTDGTKIVEGAKTTRTTTPDGTVEVTAKDGYSFTRKPDGTEIIKGARGAVKITHPDGTVEKITPEGVRSVKPPHVNPAQLQPKPVAAPSQ